MADRLPLIDNPRSDRIRGIVALGRRSVRLKRGLLRVEGPQAVEELLRWRPATVRDVYLSEAEGPLWELAQSVTRWCHPVTESVVRAVGEETQGVFAVCTTDALAEVESLDQWPLVVLPRTQDPGNMGSIIRSADAFGAAGIITCRGGADPGSPKVIRASAGSVFHLPIATEEDFTAIASALPHALLGAAGGGSVLADAALDQPHSWAFGNEAEGLSREEQQLCDQLVAVPMVGKAESLNVGVAAGVCLYSTLAARV